MKKIKTKLAASSPPDIGVKWSARKIIITFGGCLLLSAAVWFGFLVYKEYNQQNVNNPSPTSTKSQPSTKNYSNDYWGFRFQYPATWWPVIGSYQEGDYYFASEPINFISELEPGEALLEVQTYDNYKSLSFADWLKDREQNYFPTGTLTKLDATNKNYLFAEYILKPLRPGNFPPYWDICVLSKDNKRIYVFILETDGPGTNNKFQPTFNSMVDSLNTYKGFGN